MSAIKIICDDENLLSFSLEVYEEFEERKLAANTLLFVKQSSVLRFSVAIL